MAKLWWLKHPEMTLAGLFQCLYIVAAATDSFPSIREYGSRVFRDAGVVWMEEMDGEYVMQHMFMNTVTTGVTKTQPRAIAMAPHGKYNFTHIDMDHERRLFVMADPITQKIMALSFDDYFLFIFYDLYEGTSNQVNGITIDWKSNVVYWTDALYDVILAVALKYPNAAVVIVNEGLEEPGDIVVHPNKEYLFWSEGSQYRPRLMRSGLAGENVQDLLVFRDRRPSTLYMDFNDDRLYWLYKMADSTNTDGIGSCDINGYDVKYHITRDVNFFGLNVFYERVLLAVQDDRTDKTEILMLDRNTGDTVARIPVNGRLLVLHVLDSTRQLDTRNPCDLSMCPGVCIVSNMTEKCFCSPLVSTDPDADFTCEPPPPFQGLVFPKWNGIYTVKTNFAEYKESIYSGRTNLSLVVDSRHAIKAITSDVRNDKIYFFESKTKIIKSVSTKGSLSPEVVSLAVGDVGGLAFDWLRNNLYWTDKMYGHVIVAKATGDFPFVLVRNVDTPTAIAVHPLQRVVFWSCNCVGLLERAYLDGTSRRTLAPAWNRTVTAIALDFDSDSVFLTTFGEVLVMDMSGNDVRFVYSREPSRRFSGITIFHDYVVVTDTDWSNSGLLVFNRKNGKYRKLTEIKYSFFAYGNWYGVAFHHISNQPEVRPSGSIKGSMSRLEHDQCIQRTDYCEQVCVTAARPECLCTLGYIRNGTSCQIGEPYRQFLILVDQRQRRLLQLEANRYYSIPVQVLQQPHQVEYDPVSKLVYWTDLDAGTISRAHLNGDSQEIIILDRSKYFLNLAIFPEYRLLYYLQRPRNRVKDRSTYYWDENPNMFSQLMVYQLDTGRVTSLNRVLEEPRGLTINKEYGYIFLTDVGSIWRSRVNESQFIDLVQDLGTTSLLATSGYYLFFVTVLPSRDFYRPPRTKIVQCLLNGTDITVLHDFVGDHVTSLAVSGDVIYWGNSSSRAIHSAPVSNLMSVETLGPSQMLFEPTGIYIHPPGTTTVSTCEDCEDYVCLPSLDGTCAKYSAHRQDPTSDNSYPAPCHVPDIQYGDIRGNQAGRLVPHGYVAHVQCYPAHRSSHPYPLTCVNGAWAPNPPDCVLEYDICGTPTQGYKMFTQSGKYFVYPGTTHVHVIAIGGGGGGYDVTNSNITNNLRAGDGGTSSFGEYLSAYGGFGGRRHKGGAGGHGHRNGETGQLRADCSTGGTAGVVESSPTGPGSTLSLFAGTGGYSFNCTDDQIKADIRVLLGEASNGSKAGQFGGGAGSRGGSPGGGGGWSYLPIPLSAREVVYVTVGASGYPSYGTPGDGAVIVRWGDMDFEKFPDHDFINGGCLLDL